jgi:hypothetical protein
MRSKVLLRLRDAVIMVVVTFLLLEGALRLSHHISPMFIFPDNSDTRFRGRPFDRDFGFTLNSRGFKDLEFQPEKPAGSIRIVGIGDSFVFGVVPYQYNFLTLLEERLNAASDRSFEVLNMGIPRTSPREYFSVLVKEALQLKPDVALICLFVGNDFIEISAKPAVYRSFVVAAAKYVYDLHHHVEPENVYGSRRQYDDEAPTLSEPFFLDIQAERTAVYKRSGPLLPERLPRVMAWIDEIKAVCASNGIRLFVILIPDEVQLDRKLQARVLETHRIDKGELDFDLPNRRLGDELRARRIPYLDLLEPFRFRSREIRLYKPRDTHWNIAGNRLAAELLHRFLQETLDGPPVG